MEKYFTLLYVLYVLYPEFPQVNTALNFYF